MSYCGNYIYIDKNHTGLQLLSMDEAEFVSSRITSYVQTTLEEREEEQDDT